MSSETEKNAGQSIKQAIFALVENLSFPSETDSPIETIELSAVSSAEVESKMKAENGDANAELSEINFDDFYSMYGVEKDWQNDIQKEFARKFGQALKLLQIGSREVKIFRVGGVRASLYILGKMSDIDWTGMITKIVET